MENVFKQEQNTDIYWWPELQIGFTLKKYFKYTIKENKWTNHLLRLMSVT